MWLKRFKPLQRTRKKSLRPEIKSNDGFAGISDTELEELAWFGRRIMAELQRLVHWATASASP